MPITRSLLIPLVLLAATMLPQAPLAGYALSLPPVAEAGRTVWSEDFARGMPLVGIEPRSPLAAMLGIATGTEAIDGSACLRAVVQGGPDSWNLILRTPPGLLRPHARYRIAFDYQRFGAWEADAFAYLYIRADGQGARWRPMPVLGGAPGERRHLSYEILTGDEAGCRASIGVRRSGGILVDNLRVEELPAVDLPVQAQGRAEGWRAFTGVCAHLDWRHFYRSDDEVRSGLDRIAALGAGWVRLTMPWNRLFPQPGGRADAAELARLDLIVAEAERRRLRLLGILIATPPWAAVAGDAAGAWRRPARAMADYEDYVRFLVARYRGRVAAWEVGNETNWDAFWTAPFADYLAELAAASRCIRALDPAARVLSAGFSDAGLHDLRGCRPEALADLLSPAAASLYDAFSLHLYPGTPEEAGHAIRAIAAYAAERGATRPIWITETGFSVSEGRSEAQQADFLADLLPILAGQPAVERAFIYNAKVKEFEENAYERGFGILRGDLSPRPAYLRLQRLLAATAEASHAP